MLEHDGMTDNEDEWLRRLCEILWWQPKESEEHML
jgi:hypothetical protein